MCPQYFSSYQPKHGTGTIPVYIYVLYLSDMVPSVARL